VLRPTAEAGTTPKRQKVETQAEAGVAAAAASGANEDASELRKLLPVYFVVQVFFPLGMGESWLVS